MCWSDCVDAQAGLCLVVRKSPETGFLASRPIFGKTSFTFSKWIMSSFLSFAVVGKTNFAATIWGNRYMCGSRWGGGGRGSGPPLKSQKYRVS